MMMRTWYLFTLMLMACSGYSQNSASPQQSAKEERLTGLWDLVAVENLMPDGTTMLPYDDHPEGLLFFSEDGTYAIQILKRGRPNIAANDKNKATPEENAALVQGNNSHFGRYRVDTDSHKLVFEIEHAFYPNWQGTKQERTYLLKDNELSYIVTNTTNGGAITARVVWKRKF